MADMSWIPPTCPNGHELGPGQLNLTWVHCTCPAVTNSGHQVVRCRIPGCDQPTYPPGHAGEVPDQR